MVGMAAEKNLNQINNYLTKKCCKNKKLILSEQRQCSKMHKKATED